MADDGSEKGVESKGKNKPKFSGVGTRKNLLIMLALGFVLVGFSIGGTIVALKIFGGMPEPVAEDIVDEVVVPAKKPAIYYPLKPDLIVTYLARGRHRYAQVGVTLMFRDDRVLAAVELHRPMILNALNMILSGQVYEELQTAEGKELVRLQCLQELQKLMEQEIGIPGIEQVLFTDFVMQ